MLGGDSTAEALRQENASLVANFDQIRQQAEAHREALIKERAEKNAVARQLDAVREELNMAYKQLDDIKSHASSQEEGFQHRLAEETGLKEQFHMHAQQLNAYRNQNNEMRRENTALKSKLECLSATYERQLQDTQLEHVHIVKDLNIRVEDLESRLNDKKTEATARLLQREKLELQARLKVMYEELQQLREEKERATVSIVELGRKQTEKTESLDRTNRELVGDCLRLKDHSKSLEAQNQNLQLQQERLYSEIQTLQHKIGEIEEEKSQFATASLTEKHALKRQISESEREGKRMAEELEQRLRKCQTELQSVKQENVILQQSKNEASHKHTLAINTVREEEAYKCSQLQKDKQDLNVQIETLQAKHQNQMDNVNSSISYYKQHVNDMLQQQKRAEVEEHSLRSQIEQLQSRNSWTIKERDELQNELTSLQERCDQKDQQLQITDDLKIQNNRLQLQVDYLQQDVRECCDIRDEQQSTVMSRINKMQQKFQNEVNEIGCEKDHYKQQLSKLKHQINKKQMKYNQKLLSVERRNHQLLLDKEGLQREVKMIQTQFKTLFDISNNNSTLNNMLLSNTTTTTNLHSGHHADHQEMSMGLNMRAAEGIALDAQTPITAALVKGLTVNL